MNLPKNMRKEFKKDYIDKLVILVNNITPLIKEGWSEEDVFQLLLFMEKNQDRVKNKTFQEIKNLYLSNKIKNRR
jgi:hypothetical protein